MTPTAEGEPWVSFQLMAGGLANDVDFSEEPCRWLGAHPALTNGRIASAALKGDFCYTRYLWKARCFV